MFYNFVNGMQKPCERQDLKIGNIYSSSVVKNSMLHTFMTLCLCSGLVVFAEQ